MVILRSDFGLKFSTRAFELSYGASIAIFAALLAVFDLKGGAVATEEIRLVVGQNNAYQWYQAKSMKASLANAQLELTKLLAESSADPAKVEAFNLQARSIKTKISEYEGEKKEILLGSKAVGENHWVQKIDGHLGKVIGAKEYEEKLLAIAEKGANIDIAILWLQMALVLGALGLLMSGREGKYLLLLGTIVTGLLGSFYGVWGLAL